VDEQLTVTVLVGVLSKVRVWNNLVGEGEKMQDLE
jgi:hypothetical protein